MLASTCQRSLQPAGIKRRGFFDSLLLPCFPKACHAMWPKGFGSFEWGCSKLEAARPRSEIAQAQVSVIFDARDRAARACCLQGVLRVFSCHQQPQTDIQVLQASLRGRFLQAQASVVFDAPALQVLPYVQRHVFKVSCVHLSAHSRFRVSIRSTLLIPAGGSTF